MPRFAQAATAALATKDLWAVGGYNWVSKWGTNSSVTIPNMLKDNPMPQGTPWGSRNVTNTNQYQDTPNTGVTRHYDWTIARTACDPDGFDNTCVLINGEFPGPLIEANWGDWVEVKVTNTVPDEGTALHWHGFLQKDTPYMDGVPGNNQCPIAPGSTFTYRFRADLYGSSWYHSHWSAQYGSGLYGPMVIHGPKEADYDEDLGPIMVSDYYHAYYTAAIELTLAPLSSVGPPLANNNLINGKASNSTGGPGMASFNVQSGKTYRMRIINTSAGAVQKVSIDGYTFTVFANDFVPIQPYETDLLTLGVGQRNDVIFKATGKPTDAVWMRSFRPPPCLPSAGGEEVLAAIFYENADRSQPPTTQANANAYDQGCSNDPLDKTIPLYPIPAPDPDFSDVIPIAFRPNGSDGQLLWYMQDQTFRIDYNDPILLEAKLGNLDFDPIRSVHNYGTNKTVLLVLENPLDQVHPMHLHGHNIQILQEGPCSSVPAVSVPSIVASYIPTSATTAVTPSATSTQYGATTTQTYGPSGGPSPADSYGTAPASEASSETAPASSGPTSEAPAAYSSAPAAEAYTKRNALEEFAEKRKRDGLGACWDGSIVRQDNPQRRDVHMLDKNSYIVIQWTQDNPGVWPLHCHIAWHLSAGMVWMALENPEAIQNEMEIPSVMAQTCRDWSAWTKNNVVAQIDDGL